MKSEATISSARFKSILLSKKLSSILTAYFNIDQNTSLKHIIKTYPDTLKYWAHESDIDYDVLLKLFEIKYNSEVKFDLSGRKISFRTDVEVYGSWLTIHNLNIFILWTVEK